MEKNKSSKWLILIVVLMSTFMATLDGSIVNVALPVMADKLNVDTSSIQLVAAAYLIVIVGVILIFGKLGDIYGKSKMFTFGIFMFTFGSLLCGVTDSFPMLIGARMIQAVGAAGTMANSQGIITEVFPGNERGKALGIVGTSVALGALVGPGLGGLIVSILSWEYIFLINVPIGVLALIAAIKILPKEKRREKKKLDYLGAVLFIFSVVPLFAGLSEGASKGFDNFFIIGAFIVSLIAFVLFIFNEKRAEDPLLDLGIFSNRLFTISIICGFISFTAMFCNNMLFPFYLQGMISYSPSQSGMMLMVYPLVLTVVAPLSGTLSDKIGSEILTFIGLFVGGSGLILMSTLDASNAPFKMITIIVIMSVGMGLFQSPNNSLVMSTVDRSKFGIAGSVNALVRNLGMVCGIALANIIFYGMMSKRAGIRITDYAQAQPSVFLYGMRIVYITAGMICMLGALITFIRVLSERKNLVKIMAK